MPLSCKQMWEESRIAMLLEDKTDFKRETEKGHYILIKGTIQEGVTMVNITHPAWEQQIHGSS